MEPPGSVEVLPDVQSVAPGGPPMTGPPYRSLRIFLRAFSLLAALGGLLMIFADGTGGSVHQNHVVLHGSPVLELL